MGQVFLGCDSYNLGVTPANTDAAMATVRALMDEYRVQCLWFLRRDYYPSTPEEALSVLGQIERNGDLAAFKKAGELRQWLSPHSSEPSAV